jgi:hypothetical protein
MSPDDYISPPAQTPLVYEEMIAVPLGIGTDPHWLETPRFCTDAEAASLSGVPERSLRTLQAGMVITSTQAPMRAGGYRRMWHLPEVATAAMAQQVKLITGADYRQTAQVLVHAATWTKAMFFHYVRSKKFKPEEFAADIVLADRRWVFLRTSKQVQLVTAGDEYPLPALQPIARISSEGISHGIMPDNAKLCAIALSELQECRTEIVIKLASVFRDLESAGKKLRGIRD